MSGSRFSSILCLAQWVAQQRGETLGDAVGYRVRFDDRSGPSTRILFVTPGVALAAWADGEIAATDTVILD